MNERIKELAEQAEKYADEKSVWRGDRLEYLNEFEGFFNPKFAELIIRECADLIDNVLEQGSPPNPTLGEQSIDHFGVEK